MRGMAGLHRKIECMFVVANLVRGGNCIAGLTENPGNTRTAGLRRSPGYRSNRAL
jgi:hypothetical protein